jgi:hypothetical protein
MAKMLPTECAKTTESKAELTFFHALRQKLDDDWTIFHSFGLLDKNRHGKLIDAEIDFLLFHPRLGILVIEVKGGQIAFKDGVWTQNGWLLEKSPAKQALNNKYAVLRYLKNSLRKDFIAINFAHAVSFPDCGEILDIPPDCDGICITGNDIPYLDKTIEKIILDFSKEIIPPDKTLAELILKKLSPAFDYGITVTDKINLSESKIFRLTEQQCELLNFISAHKKALIRGCAGSGKTVLALKKARELASSGKKVLLLAYNSMLCEKLQASTSDMNNIFATTFHDLCIVHLQANGLDLSPQRNDDKIWTETIPDKFLNLLDKSPIEFDAVVVDEAQDFRENYWDSVTKLVKKDGYFYIFFDPDQNLFNKKLSLPKFGDAFVLDKNCRNTNEIFKTLKPYCTGNVRISEDAPAGIPVSEIHETDDLKRRKILSDIIATLLHEGLFERQIVILGGHSMRKTCIGQNPTLGKISITENGVAEIGEIPYFTYMKFKGCEADAVILLDVSENDIRWNKEALCTAISRAKYVLHIIRK